MTRHIADDHAALLDYLYEEGDPAERLKVARHLQECAPCAVEALELQSVREMLSDWTPPPAKLAFRLVRDEIEGAESPESADRPAPRPLWWTAPGQRLLQATAAVLLFVAGMAASQVTVAYESGALTVRTRVAPAPEPAQAPEPTAGLSAAASRQSIVLPPASLITTTAAPVSPAETDDLLRRVRTMIEQSESRQQRELAIRVADVVRDFDTQRLADLRQVQQNMGQLEGQLGAEVGQPVNYVVGTSVR